MLYLAICNDDNTVKIFTDYDSFKEFAVNERYAYKYFELDNMYEIPDVNLFYYD